MVRAKCFCIFKNEADVLDDWLRYHLEIFGDGNIHLIDDHSTDESYAILERYRDRITVESSVVTTSVYKSENVSRLMNRYKHECDLLVPLDLDEFICLPNSADPGAIRAAFAELDLEKFGSFKFAFNYSAVPRLDEPADPLTSLIDFQLRSFEFIGHRYCDMNKTFFTSTSFVVTDGCNHSGFSVKPQKQPTDLWLLTFPVRGREQLEQKLCRGAVYNNFWYPFSENSCHWREGYRMLCAGNIEAHYASLTNEFPHARRTFFSEQLKRVRASSEPTDLPVDSLAELISLSTNISELLSSWVRAPLPSHPCFDTAHTDQDGWLKLIYDTDAIVRYGMLRRYNPATYIQLNIPTVLPGIDEAIEPHNLRTTPLIQPSSSFVGVAKTLRPGDILSANSFNDLEPLLLLLAHSVIVEVRRPDRVAPERLDPLFSTEELTDRRSWELLFNSAELNISPGQLPRSQWFQIRR